jgi:hypothetical protein
VNPIRSEAKVVDSELREPIRSESPTPRAGVPDGARQPAAEPKAAEHSAKVPSPIEIAAVSPLVLVLLIVLGLVASIEARGLAPALPGSKAGIGSVIAASDRLAAFLTQLFAFGGTMLAIRLGLASLRERTLGLFYRLLVVPATGCVVTLVLASTTQPLDTRVTLLLACVSSLLAVAAAVRCLSVPATRAAGFVLALVGAAALTRLGAGLLAGRASEQALVTMFGAARAVATFAFVLDLASLAIVGLWLTGRQWTRGAIAFGVMLAFSALIAWGASRGSHYDARLWQVLAARSLAELASNPAPLVVPQLRYAVEVLAWILALITLVSKQRSPWIKGAISATLLSRATADVPALALCLTLGALLASLFAFEPARRSVLPARST